MSSSIAVALQQVRKPYTITKQRERWTEDEHSKFLEALKLHGRAWRRIEEYIGTKTAVQIRSHAQKFFSKLEREQASGFVTSGHDIEVPPPRPKRKPSHPYPKKAGLNSENEPVQTPQAKPSLKLFGVMLDAPSSDEETILSLPSKTSSPEEESVLESGITTTTNVQTSPNLDGATTTLRTPVHSSEVSSRDQEVPAADITQQLLATALQAGLEMPRDQVLMNNFVRFFAAAATAAANAEQQICSPWQLLDQAPKSEITRWQSMTDSSSPCFEKLSTDKKVVTRSIGRKRCSTESCADKSKRQQQQEDQRSSPSSSVTMSSTEEDEEAGSGSCSNLPTTLTLEREEHDPRVGGFMRYKRPGQ